jgi:hypothetical protein
MAAMDGTAQHRCKGGIQPKTQDFCRVYLKCHREETKL